MLYRRKAALPAMRVSERGLSLVELIVAITIMAILAVAVLPLARLTVRREKERAHSGFSGCARHRDDATHGAILRRA